MIQLRQIYQKFLDLIYPKKLDEYHDLHEFLKTLSTGDPFALTEDDIKAIGFYVHSDGCTGITQLLHQECIKHDFRYRTGVDFYGRVTTKRETDRDFRIGIQLRLMPWQNSRWLIARGLGYLIGVLAPIAWWRWVGVFLLGGKAWDNRHECRI